MSSNEVAPISDLYAQFGFTRNPDGSVSRVPEFFPTTPPSSDPANPIPVLTKDVQINQLNKTWARIYLPRPEPEALPETKLPLIVYYHGSGFIGCSPSTTMFQKFCCDLVCQIPVVMLSVAYRLAPEHRLPAAYDDGLEALHWIKATNDEWLTKYADVSRCFLMGTSAGGNIVYNVGLNAVVAVDELAPLKIQGLILHHPYFSGVERTTSEIRLANDKILSLAMIDFVCELALPIGVERDHEYSNPMKAPKIELLDKIKKQGWRFLVSGDEGDPLIDAQIEFAKMLKENGVDVMEEFSNGGYHGIEIADESRADIFYGALKNFVLV